MKYEKDEKFKTQKQSTHKIWNSVVVALGTNLLANATDGSSIKRIEMKKIWKRWKKKTQKQSTHKKWNSVVALGT